MYLTEDLLEDIKSRSNAPISQTTFVDADLIDIATRQLRSHVVPHIMKVREDFFQRSKSYSLTTNLDRYGVPKLAIGNAVKGLYLVDSAGAKSPLQRTDSSKAYAYDSQSGDPEAYYFEGDEIVLLPAPPDSNHTLFCEYYAKPNKLIATSSCTKITAISDSAGTTTLTVDTDLSTALSIGSKIDFLSSNSPFLLWSSDVLITAITPTTIEVASNDIYNAIGSMEPQVDDYICPAGYANIPMIPEEWHDVLAQSVAVRLIRSIGHNERFQAEYAILKEMINDATELIQMRSESQPKFIAPSNPLAGIFG